MKVLIVGNGLSLLTKERKNIIDSFDIVIRINDYEIEGYESFVGAKIDIWAVDTATFQNKIKDIQTINIPEIWMLPSSAYGGEIEHFKNILRTCRGSKYFVGTQEFAKALEKEVGHFPSTGLNVIKTAMKRFGGVIFIVGFDHFSNEKQVDYFKPLTSIVPHIGEKEKRYVDLLIKNGRVERLY